MPENFPSTPHHLIIIMCMSLMAFFHLSPSTTTCMSQVVLSPIPPDCCLLRRFLPFAPFRVFQDTAVAALPIHLPQTELSVQIFAIFDGHGGNGASKLAKTRLVKELLPRLPSRPLPAEADTAGFQANNITAPLNLSPRRISLIYTAHFCHHQ